MFALYTIWQLSRYLWRPDVAAHLKESAWPLEPPLHTFSLALWGSTDSRLSESARACL